MASYVMMAFINHHDPYMQGSGSRFASASHRELPRLRHLTYAIPPDLYFTSTTSGKLRNFSCNREHFKFLFLLNHPQAKMTPPFPPTELRNIVEEVATLLKERKETISVAETVLQHLPKPSSSPALISHSAYDALT